MRLPLPDIHIATLESANGTMPNDISAYARSTRHDSIVVNRHRASPACLALLVLFFGVILQLDGTMASSVSEGMVRGRAGVTRTPEGGCRSIYMSTHLVAGWCIGKVGMGNGAGFFCRCRCRCIKHGGWGARGELILVRAAIRRSGALLLEVFWRWRWRGRRRRQRLPHRVWESLLISGEDWG
jgi:hypothetical protein